MVTVSALNIVPKIFIPVSPILSFVINKRKISELLNNANSNSAGTAFLNSGVATFQYLKKEKKILTLIIEIHLNQ